MRPSIYGGVMSGLGAQATTAAISLIDHNKPPTNRYPQQPPQVLSSRPPTYQSTQSASKKSGSLYNQQPNTSSFNPMPSQHQHKNSRTGDQYATGNFPTLQHHHDSRDRPTEVHSVQTMRHTIQGTRSNSMSNLHQNINQRSNENLHHGPLVGEHHPHNNSS